MTIRVMGMISMNDMSSYDRLLWIDVETVGIKDRTLLEIGWLFTDWDIEPDWESLKHHVVHVHHSIDDSELFAPHRTNGLLTETRSLSTSCELDDIISELHDDIDDIARRGCRIMLAGSSVGFDKETLEHVDPTLFSACHYHRIDFSVLNETMEAWKPSVYHTVPDKITDHRVSTCLHGSIEQARAYRDIIRGM